MKKIIYCVETKLTCYINDSDDRGLSDFSDLVFYIIENNKLIELTRIEDSPVCYEVVFENYVKNQNLNIDDFELIYLNI